MRLCWLMALMSAGLGCYRVDVVAEAAACTGPTCAPDAGVDDAGGAPGCQGGGPPVQVGPGLCTGDLAQRAFGFALCSCEAFVGSAGLIADGFDSRLAPYAIEGPGGSVGINGRLDLNAPGRIAGGLWLADPTGMNAGAAGDLHVERNLYCAGPLRSEADVTVAGDAAVNGELRARNLSVGGTLTLSPGAQTQVSEEASWGQLRSAPVAVGPPCACGAEAVVDIAALVQAHRDENDNAALGLSPVALRGVSGTVELGCGRYYFEGIQSDPGFTLHAQGRVAIFVQGDLSVQGPFAVTLGPDAEVDLFISGQLVSNTPPQIGSQARPARARTYVGGSGTVQLTGGGRFFGGLYAPRAELVSSGPVEVFGALFARRIVSSGQLTVHYDRALADAAQPCAPRPDDRCSQCSDCRGRACVQGQCGACQNDADCCAPLSCVAGACLIEP